MAEHSLATWLIPSLSSLLLYGVGQGLVKKNISEVPPARFCLYFVVAKAILNLSYYFVFRDTPILAPEARGFSEVCLLAYLLDGSGWLLYFQAIVHGPIAIVGTLSAAYPALTVLFARFFLGEALSGLQYVGVALVIGGCVGLSYAPAAPGSKPTNPRWIPLSFMALVLWGTSGTLLKHAYTLPGASEVNVMVFNTIGAALTLGTYGLLHGMRGQHTRREWISSFMPMGMMAGGDIAFIVATRYGPVSLTSPITGAYPLVTVVFAWYVLGERIGVWQGVCIAAILGGMLLAPGTG
jgi:drug/metabolite transporter (DMT)-like permease